MLNLYKHRKTKSKPKPIHKFNNCSHECAYHCAQLSNTTRQFRLFSILTSRQLSQLRCCVLEGREGGTLLSINQQHQSTDWNSKH